MVTLPTKKSGINKDWNTMKFLLIGMAGCGKSDFFQHSENPLYLEAEAGLNFIDACKTPVRDWSDVKESIRALNELSKSGNFPYDLIVVDTIDRINDYAIEETIRFGREKYKDRSDVRIESLGDFPGMGGGWYIRESLMKKFLRSLEALPCAVAMIGHVETKKMEEGSSQYDKTTISIGGKVGNDIIAWADHVMHVGCRMMGDTIKRTVYTKPTKSREAKSRGGIIKDGWVWSNDSKENFAKLREQFT